jgi:hypothetical protein
LEYPLPELHVELADGHRVAFPDAPPGKLQDTCFVLGIRKCGSSIMNSMITDLARLNGRHYLDIAGRFFQADIPERVWRNDAASQKLLVPGQVHGGFRAMPLVFATHEVFAASRKILLVRDPRDALVSEYFSNAYSHALPHQDGGGGATADMLALRQAALKASIETYVLRQAAALNRTFMEYAPLVNDPRMLMFRYEDVIFAKRQWVADISAHFGWPAPSAETLDGMMGWADVVPDTERSDQFIRKVRPGDHKDKLGVDIIGRLNDIMAPALRQFGY